MYNELWSLGARVVQVACVDKGNAPSTWEITPEDGAFIRGQQTAQSANGTGLNNYTLSFMTKIVRGGTGWRVASGMTPYGALFYLTSDYPEDNTFVNVNRTLLPPNSLVYNYGYSIVNQSTLTTGWNEYFPVNLTIEEGVWYNISTTISPSEYQVFLNGTKLATVSFYQANLLATASRSGSGSPMAGTWGFGPWNGQEVMSSSYHNPFAFALPLTNALLTGLHKIRPHHRPQRNNSLLQPHDLSLHARRIRHRPPLHIRLHGRRKTRPTRLDWRFLSHAAHHCRDDGSEGLYSRHD